MDERDLEWTFCRGSGNGGQHKNRTDSCCQLHHKPTGIRVRCDSERSQPQNKVTALNILKSRLQELQDSKTSGNVSDLRKSQVGCGMRGDKRRTLRLRDDVVVDHITGKSTSWTKYSKGILEDLW